MLMIDDDMSHVREERSLQVYQNIGSIQPPQQPVYQCFGHQQTMCSSSRDGLLLEFKGPFNRHDETVGTLLLFIQIGTPE
jgi:hypothetical protein